jgi:hypothetical protein
MATFRLTCERALPLQLGFKVANFSTQPSRGRVNVGREHRVQHVTTKPARDR